MDNLTDDSIISLGLKPLIISNKQDMIKRVFDWFVKSSVNPQYVSLTVKGLVPFLLLLGISEAESEALSGALNQVILAISLLYTGFVALYGFTRKVLHTIS